MTDNLRATLLTPNPRSRFRSSNDNPLPDRTPAIPVHAKALKW
jgi:hypothetical protein